MGTLEGGWGCFPPPETSPQAGVGEPRQMFCFQPSRMRSLAHSSSLSQRFFPRHHLPRGGS